jgi:periplasmic protein TonB
MNTRVARHPVGALGRIGVVAALHVAVVYLVASGLGIVPPLITEPMKGEILPEIEVVEDPPEFVPPPALTDPIRVAVPEPVAVIDTIETTETISGEYIDDLRREPEILPAGPKIVGVQPDPRHPLTQPPYPSRVVHAGGTGSVEIEVYVLPNGRVGDARVTKSTGIPALDQSAVDEAKRRWRLMPATRDGVPFAQWHKLRVVFELRDR